MKFLQLSAFQKHLEKAFPDHLSRVYLVVACCPFERKVIAEQICEAVRKKEGPIAVLSFDGKEIQWPKVREELDTASFLKGYRVIILDEVDKLKKTALTALSAYVLKPSNLVYLILGATSSKTLAELYKQGSKELIACDISAEKPWDRKERLKTYLIKYTAKEGKILTREAVDMLLEKRSRATSSSARDQ